MFPSPERFPHFPKLKDKRNTQVELHNTKHNNNTRRTLNLYLSRQQRITQCVLCTEFACYTIKLTHVIPLYAFPISCSLLLPHLRVSTTIYSQVCELQGSPMISYFSGHSGTLSPPWSPWSQQLGEHSS